MMFQYNGKEKQEEFGLNWLDYGARNYDVQLGRWYSIDRKSEKYVAVSPYTYVANMPIHAIDPDGEEIVVIGDDTFKSQVFNALLKIAMTEEGLDLIANLAGRDGKAVIFQGVGDESNITYARETKDGQLTSFVRFNTDLKGTVDGVERIPFISLGHELVHAKQYLDGITEGEQIIDSSTPFIDGEENTMDSRETEAVHFENHLRSAYGYGIRRQYDGQDIGISNDKRTFTDGFRSFTGRYSQKNNRNYQGKFQNEMGMYDLFPIIYGGQQGEPAENYSGTSKFSKSGIDRRTDMSKRKNGNKNATVIRWD